MSVRVFTVFVDRLTTDCQRIGGRNLFDMLQSRRKCLHTVVSMMTR